MNIFYNKKGLGDVLLVQLTTEEPSQLMTESKTDITLIQDESTKEIVAFNLFNASNYMKLEDSGQVKLTESLFEKIETALEQNDVDLKLDVDFTPKFVVGHVTEKEKHPNADKLNICKVDVGNEVLTIVCGAANVAAGQKVVVAKVGAVMPSGMVIRDAELRGIPSSGMICSATELNLPDAKENTGILVLEDKKNVGEPFLV